MTDTNGGPSDVDWDDVSFAIRSRYRVAVLRRLADGPATPSTIATDVGLPIAHVSRALRELRDRGLVELLVSEHQRKGRLYGLTVRGERTWETIDREGLR